MLAAIVILLASGCHRRNSREMLESEQVEATLVVSPILTNISSDCGLHFTYRNGQDAGALSIVESLGGGVGIADFDRDGWQDVFCPGGGGFKLKEALSGLPHGYFRQIETLEFEDRSLAAGIHDSRRYSHGCAIGDFDNDGFSDVLVTGYGGLELFTNQGDGTFTETHNTVGLDDSQWSSSAAWGDFNSDGDLDLYVAHYVDWSWDNTPECLARENQRDICPPRAFRGLDDVLYLSDGHGAFSDVSREVGLAREGKGLGVVAADLDGDSDIDIYVANDTVDNFCYLNDGTGHFEEIGTVSGLATDDRGAPNGSMGIAVLDYDGNNLLDVWVANYENESFALYRNEGHASFSHVSQATGIHALGSSYVGFGTAACDIDRDGDEDLIVTNGHVIRFPQSGTVKQKPLLLINEDKTFRPGQFSIDDYFGQTHHGRGLAVGDLDNDGDGDLAISHNNEPVALLKNDTIATGDWLGVRLVGRSSNRDAVGAQVLLITTGARQLRTVIGGGSYLSQSDLRLLWGVPPNDRAIRLEISWPNGRKQNVPVQESGHYVTVIEPSG